MTQTEIRSGALERAQNGQSMANYPAIVKGFIEKGILEVEIRPRENVLTFHAWQALGRKVKKGEHGVKVFTYAHTNRTVKNDDGTETLVEDSMPWHTTVFHVSQTEEVKK